MSTITVFTPTYNRANTLDRVYNSLKSQTYRDFEWIIVDDGSTDNTKEVVDNYIAASDFPIRYFYQKNSGKHVAINRAVKESKSEFFIIADSDDSFKDIALETFINEWELIPNEEKPNFKGLICKCYDAETGEDIGDFSGNRIDATELEAGFILKFRFEKWSFFKTDVLREFPFPEPNGNLKFFPETVVWQNMSRKYKTRYINIALRAYYRDQENALTNKKTTRYNENIYLWQHYINNMMDYSKYNRPLFLKSFVGISRDNMLCGNNYKHTMAMINKPWKKAVATMFYPAAYLLKLKYIFENNTNDTDTQILQKTGD
jgi:glycosyltransferase involved in cell wall biosynthesis